MEISIVIPCFNEENNLKRGVLDQVSSYLKTQKYKWEVLVVDDESTDNSKKRVQDYVKKHPNFKLVAIKHGGKPAAVWAGIQAAKYNTILFTDMDQSTPLKELEKLTPSLGEGYQVVLGSRGESRDGNSLLRKLMAWGFRSFRKAIILSHIEDTQCGFKVFETKVAKRLFPKLGFFSVTNTGGWTVSSFDVELIFMAQKCGYKIKEVVVDWRNEDTSTTKGDNYARFKKESIQMLKEIFRVKRNDLLGKYEKI